jgi:hypothetical protein
MPGCWFEDEATGAAAVNYRYANRDTLATISSQLEIMAVERASWRGMPPIVHPLVIGEVVRNAR